MSLAWPAGFPVNPLAWLRRTASDSDRESDSIRTAIAELSRVNGATEQDFLDIGAKLTGFLEAAREIASDAGTVVQLISGEQGARASGVLAEVLERSNRMQAQSDRTNDALSAIERAAGLIQRTFSGIRETVTTFRALGTITQIETARLHGSSADFAGLAEDVKSLAESIHSRGNNILDAAGQLSCQVNHTLETATAVAARHMRELPSVISGVIANLESFRSRQEDARATSVRLAEGYTAISKIIEDMVTSIQFHDITRQQVEHVIEALGQVRAAESGPTRRGARKDRTRTATVVKLQLSQLSSAGETFASSTAQIGRGLEHLAERVAAMADESKSLLGLSQDDSGSFFLQMENCFSTILDSIGKCAVSEQAIRDAAGNLELTLQQMRGHAEEIRGVEIRMERIALNAGVRAAHIGAQGNALSVLADAIQRLAADSSERSEAVRGALESMGQGTGDLAETDQEFVASDTVLVSMRLAIEDLHSAAERSYSLIHQLGARGEQLCEEARAAGARFDAARLFSEGLGRAREALEGLYQETGASPEHDEGSLAEYANLYTMRAERDVHAALAKASPDATVQASAGLPECGGDAGLGENVELF